jgi:hypothetical protein
VLPQKRRRGHSSGWSSLAAPYATQLTEPHTAHTAAQHTCEVEVERLVLTGSTLCHATHCTLSRTQQQHNTRGFAPRCSALLRRSPHTRAHIQGVEFTYTHSHTLVSSHPYDRCSTALPRHCAAPVSVDVTERSL